MSKKPAGNVRIGIVSFITLLAILLMSVLAVLCVVTARATWATTQKQGVSVSETYQIDGVGQAILSQVDAQAAQVKSQGGTAGQVAAYVKSNAAAIQTAALDQAGATDAGLDVSLAIDGSSVEFTVLAANGRKLEASVTVTDALACDITQWKMSTAQAESSTNLWSGSGVADTSTASTTSAN